MNGYAEVQSYDNFISELNNFCVELQNCCATLIKSGQLIVDGTDSKDLPSLKAQKKLVLIAKDYQAIIDDAKKLANDLGQERDEIIKIMQEANNF